MGNAMEGRWEEGQTLQRPWDGRPMPQQFAEELNVLGLIKNAKMQGAQNPESGVATNKKRLLPRPRRGPEAYLDVRRNDEGPA